MNETIVKPKDSDSQTLLNQIVLDYMREQKRKRIWRWLLRILLLILIVFIYYSVITSNEKDSGAGKNPHAGLIDLNGTIFDTQKANAEFFAKGLENAYKKTGLKAVIIRINSPGGSPVQADYMYNTIRYYRKAFPSIKVYAVCVDMCASAAYYVASAAEEIYANESSLVGSIGVLYNGFGFVDSLQKLGITRRLQTAGNKKGFLDPFSPEDPAQVQVLQGMLNEIHQIFIQRVKEGRGSRLKIDPDTFSGLFWTGVKAKERGLIDGFLSSGQLAKGKLKLSTVVDYTYEETVFERMSKKFGSALAHDLVEAAGFHRGVVL